MSGNAVVLASSGPINLDRSPAAQEARKLARAQARLERCEQSLNLELAPADYLTLTPDLAKEKVQASPKKKSKACRKGFAEEEGVEEEPVNVGYPRLPGHRSDDSRPLFLNSIHDPTKDKPWKPETFDSREAIAHADHLAEGGVDQNGGSSIRPIDLTGDTRTDDQTSWKRRQMINQLLPAGRRYLREYQRRKDALERQSRAGESSGEEVGLVVTSPDASDRLLTTALRIGKHVKRSTGESTKHAQARMANLLVTVAKERPDCNISFPESVYEDTVEAGEEYEIIEVREKDELEDVFDQPNASIGVFDKAEVDLYYEMQRLQIVKEARKNGHNAASIDQMQLRCLKKPGTELERLVDEAREKLVESGKLLPRKVAAPKKPSTMTRRSPPTPPSTQPTSSTSSSAAMLSHGDCKRKLEDVNEDGDEVSPSKRPKRTERRAPDRYEGDQ